ncbi:MAG: hypothetical protein QM256_12750 [Pseudomonadota bacterium]|jgi:hypothetical protein|nr:hypothetical protein [Syntrophaceae bacterium]MDI9556635.1 hypothetical protein [Pseudomonadota bacterium]HNU85397.1 hypothetical protein [Syntrophales bacterium]HOF74800.1 hypothetical protein [Syntrophales bacterium]HOR31675.1 hypothetical protein [Syntrophales bacterium]
MDDRPQRKVKVNLQNLYREEMYTDMRTAALRQLTPVKPNGEIDKTRKFLFVGQTNIMSPQGPLPVQFPIDAKNLQEAAEKFPDVMEQFLAKLAEEIKDAQRQEQSRIIVPEGSLADPKIILK